MDQTTILELSEFRSLMRAIRAQAAYLQDLILSDTEEKEEMEILNKFNGVIQMQVFSTIANLTLYQLRGWRELINE